MALTPMMQQYFSVKDSYKDCIVFFRLGDFYEMFFDDAILAAKVLEVALTGRDCGLEERAPMCGIPYHAASVYISKLISKGHKVAICEQLENPSEAKGIVKRGITKVITPGTYTDSNFLDENKNNFLLSVCINDDFFGLSYADVSTGEFYSTEHKFDLNLILDEISKVAPSEILIPEDFPLSSLKAIEDRFSIVITKLDSCFYNEEAMKTFNDKFQEVATVYSNELKLSCCSLFKYIIHTHKVELTHFTHVNYYNIVNYLSIDINSRRNLELTETIIGKSKKGSLLWVLDKTNTVMGSRVLRKWVEQPITDIKEINNRLNSVEELVNNIGLLQDLKENLKGIYDIERIVGKISTKNVNAKELISLKASLGKIPNIKEVLKGFNCCHIGKLNNDLDELKDVFTLIDNSIIEEPSLSIKDGDIINNGYNTEIDELRNAKTHGKEWLIALESREKEETGIKSLKVSHNKVFGYYIEVTNANLSLIPEGRYIRKQTLSGAERFFTEELKSMEGKIFGAIEKLASLEYEIFVNIRDAIEKEVDRMKKSASIIAQLDCLVSLAMVALENNYCRPEINEAAEISIKEGRHPVVEKMIPSGGFVSNDINIDTDEDQLLLITGPNMAGKSTYMRQIALIVIMTQIGSFVPAKYAKVSICDKIFTRIGASDDLAAGKSTFMVEMWEVSNILKNATKNSLILLDEVGRGTSTFDGLSIAWAVIEYICNTEKLKCKTLFATHYHELTKLEGVLKGLKNYSIAVKKVENEIVFLRKIITGGADESYGIEVAKLAGIPKVVIERAKEILNKIENEKAHTLDVNSILNIKEATSINEVAIDMKEKAVHKNKTLDSSSVQLGFEDYEKQLLLKEISQLNVLEMTPMQGFNKLYEIISKAKNLF